MSRSGESDSFANQPVVIDNVSPASQPHNHSLTHSFTELHSARHQSGACFAAHWCLLLLCWLFQGSGLLKAGFAGAEMPKVVFPA